MALRTALPSRAAFSVVMVCDCWINIQTFSPHAMLPRVKAENTPKNVRTKRWVARHAISKHLRHSHPPSLELHIVKSDCDPDLTRSGKAFVGHFTSVGLKPSFVKWFKSSGTGLGLSFM